MCSTLPKPFWQQLFSFSYNQENINQNGQFIIDKKKREYHNANANETLEKIIY